MFFVVLFLCKTAAKSHFFVAVLGGTPGILVRWTARGPSTS
jgi:hypothetical protein